MSDRVDPRTVPGEGRHLRLAGSLSRLRQARRRQRRLHLHAAYVTLAAVLAIGAPVEASAWRGPIRLPWYNQEGQPLGCPGAGAYKRWKRVVAVRPSDPRFRCGDRVELRYHGQTVTATVADSFSEAAPSWVVFDAAAIIACRLLLHPSRRTPKRLGYVSDCATLSGVEWRKVS
jgi:hypothetical protein